MLELLLEVSNLKVCYDKALILSNASIRVDKEELVGLVGPNGAGKSTLLRAITGLVHWEREIKRGTLEGNITFEGRVEFNAERIDGLPPYVIVQKGLVHCPERRRPLREMTVLENLDAGGYLLKNKKAVKSNIEKVCQLFPVLKERSGQISGTLSGGEQQMLAIGRALMSQPILLCIDEPSTGLAPILRAGLFEKIIEIRNQGITILLVEQEVSAVFEMASRNYILSSGKIIAEGTGKELVENELLRKTYLGL